MLGPIGGLWAQTTLYWDANGSSSGAGSSPSATWSTSSSDTYWNSSSGGSGSTVRWSNGGYAIFSAGTDATNSYTVTVSGSVNTAGITIQEGTPTFTGGTITFNDSTPDFVVGTGLTTTVNSVIAGTNGLAKSGAGTLIFDGSAKTYTGTTSITAGTLQLNASNLINDASGIAVSSGATFLFNWGVSETVGAISGAGTINTRGGTFTFGDSTSTTFSGVLSDNGSYGTMIKQGSGTITLSGNNTYTGLTTINAGALVAASDTALGGSTYGNTIASGAALHFQNNINLTEGQFNVTGSGVSGTGALRNLSGNNTLNAALDLGGNTTFASDAGTLTTTGQVNLGSGNTLTVAGAGNITMSGSITNSGTITKTGSGTLTFSGSSSNSFSGGLNINDGTVVLGKSAGTNATGGGNIAIGDGAGAAGSAILRLDASNQIPDYISLINISADGRLSLNNQSETVDRIGGTGTIDTGASGYLGIGVNSGSSTFSGALAGSGTIEKLGSGTLTLSGNVSFSGTLLLSGGTLQLNNANFILGTLTITADTTIDFGGTASTLNVTNFSLINGAKLTITNWTEAADFFIAGNWSGATQDVTGSAPMNTVVYTGYTAPTVWASYDDQIRPNVPEPSTYGLLSLGAILGFFAWRRRRSRRA